MSLFDAAGRERVEACVRRVESRTAAEIAVVTLSRCDGYHELRLLYAAAFGMAAAAWTHWLAPGVSVPRLLWLQLTVAVLVWLVSGLRPVLRVLVPAARTRQVSERAAHEAFLRHEVFATRARTGVLILLCELERCVVILGDKGIHERVKDSGWQAHVQHLVAAIRAGRAADGTCEVIEAVGALLATQLPAASDDDNELSDAVREDA